MKNNILVLALILTVFTVQAQRNVDRTNFRAGLTGGVVTGDFSESYSFGLGVDVYHHWGVSKLLDVGVTGGFFNAFGENEVTIGESIGSETDGFDNYQYIPVGISLRAYPGKNVGFKFGADVGYAIGVSEGNEGALYYRPSMGIDLRNGSNEINISYFAVNGDGTTYASVLASFLILF